MQLQVAKPENVTQQKDGNSPLPGYHRFKTWHCWSEKTKPFYDLEDCSFFCGGCTFCVDLRIDVCGCCEYPVRIVIGYPDSVTLYKRKGTEDPCRSAGEEVAQLAGELLRGSKGF